MLRGGERGVVDAQTRSFIRPRRVGGAGEEEVPCMDWLLEEKKRERRGGGGGGRARGGGGRGGGGEAREEEEEEEVEKVVVVAVAVRWLCFSCWLLLLLGGAERCGLINFA